ncbi:hypothetical protein PSECIP111951_02609 [Pseudoalteromonas holothuriae]|uniref:Zinc-ribbon domain-containing protein n=1 Tax=Pseudoalteromonas holothuriae TaxID=2963714 RepID=A0A9W4R306_9GAMM|nr:MULTISPECIES: putative zinc-binding metallopeptidase [unclassified Pseudoalteromonas]CAH9062028.1 hypothetical protein PSECIP111951_02609 [Pseudoalteromonas sp. CIP111951]CAH9065851.1 hypothetical protein PSECIP111854_03766 [Pseudoalteromonas sp. CIP111854]
MLTFYCQCGNVLHFPNSQCVKCDSILGFLPNAQKLCAFTKTDEDSWLSAFDGKYYRPCKNYVEHQVCNWMIELHDSNQLCLSCRLTETIPNLNDSNNIKLWFSLEQAKRRLLYTVIKLKLPIKSRSEDINNGLGFAFLQDQVEDSFGNELTIKEYVVTGHSNGLITINLNEADAATRAEMREKMNENYRTLIGHFRHESGHYYWDRLIDRTAHITEFRNLFGDERLSYQNEMQNYYQNGPVQNWQDQYISAYASMHPWEDWAETWAHYLHMVDTLETANNFGVGIADNTIYNPLEYEIQQSESDIESGFTRLFNDWCTLTRVLNALNRSMGMDDAYPFVISVSALNKLRFIHNIVNHFNNTSSD